MAGSKYGDGAQISGSLAVSGSATFNEESEDVDFRIESDNRPYAFYVDAANDRVGLGCFTTPNHNIEIQHEGADGDEGIMIIRYDGAVYPDNILGGIGFDSADGNRPSRTTEASVYVAGYASEHHSTTDKGGYLVFGTAPDDQDDDTTSIERMRITSDGKVGIGTDAPDYTLDVAGDIGVDQYIYHNGDGNTLINFADDKIILKAGGKAMITVEEKGSAPHEITLNDGSNNIDFVVKGNGSGEGNPGLKFDASTNRLGINGVGTPDESLHVDGNLKVVGDDPRIKIDGDTDSHPGLELYENGTRKWIVFNDYTTDNLTFKTNTTTRMAIDQNGNVGIGTTTINSNAVGVLTIKNGTSPSAVTSNQIYIGSKDSTGLSSNGATVELFLEGGPEASSMSVPNMSHRISVWINGTEYFIYLDPA